MAAALHAAQQQAAEAAARLWHAAPPQQPFHWLPHDPCRRHSGAAAASAPKPSAAEDPQQGAANTSAAARTGSLAGDSTAHPAGLQPQQQVPAEPQQRGSRKAAGSMTGPGPAAVDAVRGRETAPMRRAAPPQVCKWIALCLHADMFLTIAAEDCCCKLRTNEQVFTRCICDVTVADSVMEDAQCTVFVQRARLKGLQQRRRDGGGDYTPRRVRNYNDRDGPKLDV